jgi:hypothetical protein
MPPPELPVIENSTQLTILAAAPVITAEARNVAILNILAGQA